jgi:hypothetical protein
LTIQAYPGETPVFVNGDRPFIAECDYLRVEGLHFQNGKSISIRGLDRTTIQVVNNTFTGSGYGWSTISTHGDNILLEGNTCDIEGNTVGTQGHCYYISHGTNITVRHNVATGMTGYGIHVFDQRRSEDPPDFERLIKDVIIEGNVCSHSKERAGIILAAYDHARIENVLIRNNVVFSNTTNGIVVRSDSKDVYVYNNTVYGNDGDGISINYGGMADGTIDGIVIRNNLLDTSGHGTVYHVNNAVDEPTVSLDHNLYWPGPPNLNHVSDAHPVTGDPQFVDPAGQDFHLLSASPAIDAGVTITQVTDDLDSNPRPLGSAYDIGAYEYVPTLILSGTPADRAIHLTWTVNTTLPVTSTWRLAYDGPTGDQPSPITGIISPTRAYPLTGLTNYTFYTVTLNAMLASAPFLTDTVRVMPTDIFVYLPLVLR